MGEKNSKYSEKPNIANNQTYEKECRTKRIYNMNILQISTFYFTVTTVGGTVM